MSVEGTVFVYEFSLYETFVRFGQNPNIPLMTLELELRLYYKHNVLGVTKWTLPISTAFGSSKSI